VLGARVEELGLPGDAVGGLEREVDGDAEAVGEGDDHGVEVLGGEEAVAVADAEAEVLVREPALLGVPRETWRELGHGLFTLRNGARGEVKYSRAGGESAAAQMYTKRGGREQSMRSGIWDWSGGLTGGVERGNFATQL
jgi:hypothetical protein